ncbi:hypothetical protein [Lentzea guizhouensis]|uniref:hypothetical protein n=1 Tax=Lentzea guizhouensis TaxID=1586287 RepID=UPI0012B68E65|nr:hypothetical protein [Lentzea guizhouensis]
MSRHSRRPHRQPQRRQPRSVLVLQIGLVLLQGGLALVEFADAVTSLLGHVW